ncbi:outer membrane protein with beta-barrel domain [Flavobacteriaceae bacterium MAR_2010_72]|nr:outer membrane protein with beta-barrel domain [Flavobacteriaceae bacterium MAR_2010_72]TVZ58542.1 outer membrane protein with beta-barrel domain [Flavobacteriaceae bacterium MAR_2010_105]
MILGGHYALFGQNTDQTTLLDTAAVDEKYREDQFYVSVTYNLLGNKPQGVSQNGFSGGFHVGFIRDMPINKARNLAFGLGLGISTNSYNQSLLISKEANTYQYSILNNSETPFTKNKFSAYAIELPFEFRWRTSTPTDYNFWRIYTGFKVSYRFYTASKFKGDSGSIELYNISDFNDFQYGLITSIGYSNININFYYALNDIFKDSAMVNDEPIGMNAIKIGLIYYIL